MTYDPAVKDDSIFEELIEWASQWAQERGIPESRLHSSVSTEELRARVLKYEELRQAPPVYRTVIYPLDGGYRGYAPAIPDIVVEGPTPESVRAELVKRLGSHLKMLIYRGEPIPREQTVIDTIEVSLESLVLSQQ